MINLNAYSDAVREHFQQPHNVGHFDEQAQGVGTGMMGSSASGDVVRVQVLIVDGVIIKACFKAQGTCATIAAGSFITDWVIGKAVSDLANLSVDVVLSALNLPQVRKHSVLLVLEALQKAVS